MAGTSRITAVLALGTFGPFVVSSRAQKDCTMTSGGYLPVNSSQCCNRRLPRFETLEEQILSEHLCRRWPTLNKHAVHATATHSMLLQTTASNASSSPHLLAIDTILYFSRMRTLPMYVCGRKALRSSALLPALAFITAQYRKLESGFPQSR